MKTERRGPMGTAGSWFLEQLVRLRRSGACQWIPRWLRGLGYRFLPGLELDARTWHAEYRERIANAHRNPLQTEVRVGIITDPMYRHGLFEAACMELGVPHQLIDIRGPDWMERIHKSGCDAFVAWPSPITNAVKRMYDDRLKVLSGEMKKPLFPCYEGLWLWESKLRIANWLDVHDIPRPKTWVFYGREETFAFIESAEYPLVFKTDLGSSAHGVEIVRSKREARRLVKLCFSKGYLPARHEAHDRHRGCVILQQHLGDVAEWRMMRVGDSYFGYKKVKTGDYHSGTHLVDWDRPPDDLCDLTRDVTELGPFLSMSLDVFETPGGRYFVNELHPLWGWEEPSEMYVEGEPGRFLYDPGHSKWRFEPGVFSRNASCNLRLKTFFDLLGYPLRDRGVPNQEFSETPSGTREGGNAHSVRTTK